MIIEGRVWKLGDDVNTDVIFPGKYCYSINDPHEMAEHALEGLIPDFAQKVQQNDIIVAGKNFGCGSSREQAATCLKYASVGAVVASSFGRIFFRNAVNMGLPTVRCVEVIDAVSERETLRIDFGKGELTCGGGLYRFSPLPEFVLNILNAGGLIPHTKKELRRQALEKNR